MVLKLRSSEPQVCFLPLYHSLPPAILGFQDCHRFFFSTLGSSRGMHHTDLFSLCTVPVPQGVLVNWDWEWKQVWEERRKWSFHDGAHKTFCILSAFTATHMSPPLQRAVGNPRAANISLLCTGQTPPQAGQPYPHSTHPQPAMCSHVPSSIGNVFLISNLRYHCSLEDHQNQNYLEYRIGAFWDF